MRIGLAVLGFTLSVHAQVTPDGSLKNPQADGVIRPSWLSTGLSYSWSLSQDGKWLAVRGYPCVKIYSLPNFEEVSSFSCQVGVSSVAFLEGGERLLLARSNTLSERYPSLVVNWRTGDILPDHPVPVEDVSLVEPVGKTMILLGRHSRANNPMVSLWDYAHQRIVWQMPDKARYYEKAWTVLDEKSVLVYDKIERDWRRQSGKWRVVNIDGSSSLFPVDADWVVSLGARDRLLVGLNGKTHRARLGENGNVELGEGIEGIGAKPIAVSRDGRLVPIEDYSLENNWSEMDIVIVDTESGNEVGRIKDPCLNMDKVLDNSRSGHFPLFHVQFIPDSERLILGSDGESTVLYNWKTGKPVGFKRGHQGSIMHARFVENGKKIVSLGSLDQELRFWDGETMELVERKPFLIEGRVVSAHPKLGGRVLMRLGPRAKFDRTGWSERYQVVDLGESEYPPFEVFEKPWEKTNFFWPSDKELITLSGHAWARIEISSGEVVERGKLITESNRLEVTGVTMNEEGTSFYRYGGGARGSKLSLSIQKLSESKTRNLGEIDPGIRTSGGFHVIPDGRHLAWNGWILERDPFRMVSPNRFPDREILKQRFSRDGANYVVALGKPVPHGELIRVPSRVDPAKISLRETLEDKVLHSWKGLPIEMSELDLSPDLQRVLVRYQDGTMQLLQWP